MGATQSARSNDARDEFAEETNDVRSRFERASRGVRFEMLGVGEGVLIAFWNISQINSTLVHPAAGGGIQAPCGSSNTRPTRGGLCSR